jgi:hypothetical protein
MVQDDESSGYGIILHVPCQASRLELPCLGPSQFCTIVQCCTAALHGLVPSGNAGWLEASVLEALVRRLAPEASAAARGGVVRCPEAPRRPWLGAWRARAVASVLGARPASACNPHAAP